MPANVEIKAKLRNREEVLETAKKLSGGNGTVLVQEDTFFNCPNGRLKLRMQTGCPGQLIFYSREDIAGPKLSQYRISKVKDVDDMKTTLEQALGIMGCVRKTRLLFMVGQTRIHIDKVEGLGDFIELEVVMYPEQELTEGERIAEDLMSKLGVTKEDLETQAYIDLLPKCSS